MQKFLLFFLLIIAFNGLLSQPKFHPTVSTSITMNADGIYVGPAFALGIEKHNKKLHYGLSVHYFGASVQSGTFQDTGILRMLTANIYAKKYLFKERLKKLYAGLGLSFQYRYENYRGGSVIVDNEYRRNILLCYIVGYTLSNMNNLKPKLHIELFSTGPYTEQYDNGSYTEIFTQIGIGVKLTL